MNLLVSGGGTAGHIQPALAIADAFIKRDPKGKVAFCGTPNGMEADLASKSALPFYPIEIQGLRRNLSFHNLKTLALTVRSFSRAKKILDTFSPDIVIGTGGYVCYPILRCASKRNIVCAIHESNAIPGLVTKLLASHVDVVFANFTETEAYLQRAKKFERVGNPIRNSFLTFNQESARQQLQIPSYCRHVLLSFGGSLGAKYFNDAVLSFLKEYTASHPYLFHIHICGKRDYQRCLQVAQEWEIEKYPHIRLLDFVYDMPLYLSAASVVLCRAGAMTLSELSATQTPSILVPSPYVTNNHQFHNAKIFENAGASICLEEKDCNAKSIETALTSILFCKKKYMDMQKSAKSFASHNCANEILDFLLKIRKNF